MTTLSHEHDEHHEYEHGLESDERDEVKHRSSPGGKIVYHAVLKEADEELARSSSASPDQNRASR